MLLHAIDKWPGAITTFLWPQAMRHTFTIRNHTPFKHNYASPIELFTNSRIQPNLKHLHTFGCPVYVLDKTLQAQRPTNAWLPRSRIGIYLGQYEQHERNVSLVTSLNTGLVLPQFHVEQDNLFELINASERNYDQQTWMVLSGLKRGKQPEVLTQPEVSTNEISVQDVLRAANSEPAADINVQEEHAIDQLATVSEDLKPQVEPTDTRESTTCPRMLCAKGTSEICFLQDKRC